MKRVDYSEDPNVKSARKSVQEAFHQYTINNSNDNQEKLQSEKETLNRTYNDLFEVELNKMIDRVENASAKARHGESWRLINEITGRKAAKRGILKGSSSEDRLEKWRNYFNNLLGNVPTIEGEREEEIQPVLDPLDINEGPFTTEEYMEVKNNLTKGKSSGPDGIPPEVLKRCNLDNIILSFANNLIELGHKPDQWSIMDIIPLPKKGSLDVPEHYRGIALSSLAAKITNKMILNRIQPVLDHHLRPNQNGFRPARSTTAHILGLRRLIEGVKSNNLKSILVFVDFKKAFDSIHRGKMRQILLAYGIPIKLVKTIMKLYEGTKAKVVSPDGDTALFDILEYKEIPWFHTYL